MADIRFNGKKRHIRSWRDMTGAEVVAVIKATHLADERVSVDIEGIKIIVPTIDEDEFWASPSSECQRFMRELHQEIMRSSAELVRTIVDAAKATAGGKS